MAVRIKVDPLNLNYDLLLSATLSPQEQTQIFAEYAQQVIDEAAAQNAKVLGRTPPYTVAVDGREGAPLNSVKVGGIIFAEFELAFEALDWIAQKLREFSPVGKPPKDPHPGLYKASHVLFADNEAVDDGAVPPIASEYAFINIQPYARKIERGLSSQRPEGVYQAVAQMAATSKFGNVVKVKFGYRTPLFGAIDEWASSSSARALAARKRKGNKEFHAEWLRRQPAIIVTLPG